MSYRVASNQLGATVIKEAFRLREHVSYLLLLGDIVLVEHDPTLGIAADRTVVTGHRRGFGWRRVLHLHVLLNHVLRSVRLLICNPRTASPIVLWTNRHCISFWKSFRQTIFSCHVDLLDCFSLPFIKLHHRKTLGKCHQKIVLYCPLLNSSRSCGTRRGDPGLQPGLPHHRSPRPPLRRRCYPFCRRIWGILSKNSFICYCVVPFFECWSVVLCGVAR